MRKTVIHFFLTNTAAQEAVRASDIEGIRRIAHARIENEYELHLFRTLRDQEDLHTLAGLAAQELIFADGIDSELQTAAKAILLRTLAA